METGRELRDKGISTALANANEKVDNWGVKAFNFLKEYMKSNKEFLAEDVREASKDIVPEPPNKRAWGAIIVRAYKGDLIKRKSYVSVKNPKAHKAIATLWEVV